MKWFHQIELHLFTGLIDCELPPETGFCAAYFQRWFFNSTSENCEQFVYGGCGGNPNRFHTAEQCQTQCAQPASPTSNSTAVKND